MEIYRLLDAPEPFREIALERLRTDKAEPNKFAYHYLLIAKSHEAELLMEIEVHIPSWTTDIFKPDTHEVILCIKEMT